MFTADRAAMGYFYGWQMQRGDYCNGITVDPRQSWRDIFYVPNNIRYWTVGSNLKRWMLYEKWKIFSCVNFLTKIRN